MSFDDLPNITDGMKKGELKTELNRAWSREAVAQKTIDAFAKESLQDREKLRNTEERAAELETLNAVLREKCAEAENRLSRMRKSANEWANYAFKNHGNDAKLYNGLQDLARLE